MNDPLKIYTLGGLAFRNNAGLITGFPSRKAEALLVYLACARQAQSREFLAELLWNERSQAQSLSNLRSILAKVRPLLVPYLEIERRTIGLNPNPATYQLDVAELDAGLNAMGLMQNQSGSLTPQGIGQLELVLTLYRGEFLEGFSVPDSQGFEDWMLQERERIRRGVIDALHLLVHNYIALADYAKGNTYTARLLQIDRLDEKAHRRWMELLALTDHRNAALAHYDTCRKLLWEELGVQPEPETTAVFEAIRDGVSIHRIEPSLPPAVTPAIRSMNLPRQATPFVGRTVELSQIAARLADP